MSNENKQRQVKKHWANIVVVAKPYIHNIYFGINWMRGAAFDVNLYIWLYVATAKNRWTLTESQDVAIAVLSSLLLCICISIHMQSGYLSFKQLFRKNLNSGWEKSANEFLIELSCKHASGTPAQIPQIVGLLDN